MIATDPTPSDLHLAFDHVRKHNRAAALSLVVDSDCPVAVLAVRHNTTPGAIRALRGRFAKHFERHIGRPMPRYR